MRTAKEIYLHVGVPLSADYLDKMRPEYRAFQESDIERILKEAFDEAILSVRPSVIVAGSDSPCLLAERES